MPYKTNKKHPPRFEEWSERYKTRINTLPESRHGYHISQTGEFLIVAIENKTFHKTKHTWHKKKAYF